MEEKRYSAGEEFANTLTHGLGALLAAGMIVHFSCMGLSPRALTATVIYAASAFLAFGGSALYHGVQEPGIKRRLRKLDHSLIYAMIAGTYTPILLIGFPFSQGITGIIIAWSLALAGVIFACISLKNRLLNTILYLAAGWGGLFLLRHLWLNFPHSACFWLVGGGVAYSAGSVFYMWRKAYSHAVWHLFVLAGAAFHCMSILVIAGADPHFP